MVGLSINIPEGFLEDEEKTLIVSKKRKQVWAVALDLLLQFDRVCKKYKIKYFCDGGTALGAARHRGFIPWDDDIDVIMSREEYNRLCEIAPQEFEEPYFWQTNETDPGSARGHAQLRNSNTTGILRSDMEDGMPIYAFNQGIFIDIFPYDSIPDDKDERKTFLDEVHKAKEKILSAKADRRLIKRLLSGFSIRNFVHGIRPLFREFMAKIMMIDRLSVACRNHDRVVQRYCGQGMKMRAPIALYAYHREILPSYFFDDEVVFLDFEFIKIPVLRHYQDALVANYGNWHEHVIGASMHGGLFIDVDKSYTEYLPKQ